MKKLFLLPVLGILLFTSVTNGQNCQICTYTVNAPDTSTYTLNSGQTLCITSSGVVNGTVILNGGIVCNSGIFRPANFKYEDGDFDNYGDFYSRVILVLKNNSRFVNYKDGRIKDKTIQGSGKAIFRDDSKK
jgi:hypothetical protein